MDDSRHEKLQIPFTFEENGFYSTVTKRARAHFNGGVPTEGSVTHKIKANKWWYLRAFLQYCLLFICWFVAFLETSLISSEWLWDEFPFKPVCAFLAGVLVVAVGLTTHHDASHYAVGKKNSYVNRFCMKFWCSIGLFDPAKWM